jgi:Domain of unknown function DUF11/Prealbumin-like fold domain
MFGKESPSGRRAGSLILALLLCLALPGAALAAPPEPVYQHGLNDCVTGDNQFWSASDGKFHWWVNQAVGSDGSSGPLKCDTYGSDQYERPTDQTFQQRMISQKPPYLPPASPASAAYLSGMAPDAEFPVSSSVFAASGKYFEYGDITRGRAGSLDASAAEGWLFFQVELFGDSTVSDSLSRTSEFGSSMYYSVRLGKNADPNKANGGILLRNQRNTNITNTWSTTDAFVFDDSNGDVSGAGGVTTVAEGGNGYELAQGNQSWLWVRRVNVPFTGPGGTVTRPAVEFAFNYKKYNQDKGKSFAPAGLSYVDLDATKGLQDNQNYLWNDKYTLSQAGSPNPGEVPGGTGTQNIYQLDTLRLGGFPPAPASLTVVKETAPASSGADQFDFTLTDKPGFKLDTDGDDSDGATASKTFVFTTFGPKTVRESQLPAGWDLTGRSCVGAPAEYGSDSATVTLAAGTNATCTFTNTKRAKVEIVKETDPAAFDKDFQFTTTGEHAADLGASFTLNAASNASTGVKLVRPGSLTVTETVPGGWDLTGVTCTGDQDSSGSGAAAVLQLAAGDQVRCVFENTKRGSVIVEKTEGGSDELQRDWQFQLSGNGIDPVTKSTTDGNPIEFGDLRAGTYTLCEVGMPLDWHSSLEAPPYDGARTDDGQTAKVCVSVTLGVGEDEKIDVDNVRPAIELEKEVRRLPGGAFAKTATAHVGDTVEYRFRVTNPGVGELSVVLDELAPDRCDAGTMTAPVGDADADGKLDPGEQWDYFCTHQVTAGDPDPLPNTAKVTGTDQYGNTDDDESSASVDVLHPDIEVDKKLRRGDSGEFVDGPIIVRVGDTIQYRFEVTNEGDAPLAVTFGDPRCDAGTLTGPTGDSDGDGKLDVDETWIYRCSHVVTSQSGDPVKNTVTVTGTDELGGTDEDKDSAEADVLHPDIEIDKQVDRAQAHVGDTLTYRFLVTDGDSDTPIGDVELTDPRCDPGTLTGPVITGDDDDLLEDGETWTYTCTHVVTEQDPNPLPNTAKVTGTDELGGRVEDEDSASVEILKPGTLVVKEGNQFAYPGDTVTFTFAVTNGGNAPLHDVTVSDDRCAPVTGPTQKLDGDQDDLLEVGEKWIFTCSKQIPPGHKIGDENPIRNVATATGKDPLGKTVTDDDDHLVRVLHPAIDIEKTGPASALVGAALAYTLTVTNPGDVPFARQDVVVTDPRCEAPPAGPNTGSDGTPGQLDPGDTWTYTCTAQTAGQPAGTFVNTATVVAKDFNGRQVTDTDPFPTVLEAQGVLPQPEIISGRARLRGPSGCVRGPFTATVRGRRIARVTFYRDGKRIKTINAKPGQRKFTVKVKPGGAQTIHRVTARVRFKTASQTRARTLRLSYQRCRKQIVRPRFTG